MVDDAERPDVRRRATSPPARPASLRALRRQQQSVGIARALAIRPRLLLFDEPTSSLDPELVGEVLQVLKQLASAGRTMVAVTHEIRFAQQVADQVLFLDGGAVLASGPPGQVLAQPEHGAPDSSRAPHPRPALRLPPGSKPAERPTPPTAVRTLAGVLRELAPTS